MDFFTMQEIMQHPLIQFGYMVLNTPGMGGFAVAIIATVSLTAYGLIVRWIRNGAQANEAEEYSYPTPALHGHH